MKASTQKKYRELMLLVEQNKAIDAKIKKRKADLLAIMLKDEQDSIKGELGAISVSGRTTAVYPPEVNERIAKIKSRAEEKGQVKFTQSTFLVCNLSTAGDKKK